MRGLIFDLDGVITDTAEYHYLAWRQLAEEEGLTFTREDNEALRGVPRRRSLELLLKENLRPDDEMQALMTRKNGYYQAYIEQITPADLLPGVLDYLHAAQAAGFQLGLGSASKNARAVCEKLGILDLFNVFGDGYSVVNAKPAPDLFIWVAGGMGLNPRDCIVFEDAEAGIEAALAGGFYAVGVGPASRVGRAHKIIAGLHVPSVLQMLEDMAQSYE